MHKVGAYLVIGALAATAFPATPSAAFGLNIGPFHLGLPFGFHHGHRHRLYDKASVGDKASLGKASIGGAAPAQSTEQGTGSALFYPAGSVPAIFDEVFEPEHAPQWPFDYGAIFRSAFAAPQPETDARQCQDPLHTEAIVGRITAEIRPTQAQQPLVQALAKSIAMTSAYTAKACPQNLPAQPAARLQLLQSQLETLTMAIDLVRPPLQQLEQSLDTAQKARFAGKPDTGATACGAAPVATDWSVDDINQSVQPDQDQQAALADLKQSFASAALDLHAHCPQPLPPTPLARLEAIEGRLDASWRAALSMQVALAKFETTLNETQRSRFETMNVAKTP
jgi:LTXXQ motif family protein